MAKPFVFVLFVKGKQRSLERKRKRKEREDWIVAVE